MSAPGYWYRAHGTLIRSVIALPEFTAAPAPGDGQAGLEILTGPEAARARDLADHGTGQLAGFRPSQLGPVVSIPDCADILVQDGRRIVITPHPDHDPAMLKLYVIGSAIGMIFQQRGHLVLHGGAISGPQGTSVFVGPSGAGKSTLIAHLAARGHIAVSDDTLVLSRDDQGRFGAWPAAISFKLWQDALAGLGQGTAGLDPVANRADKYYFRTGRDAPDQWVPIREVVHLASGDGPPALTPVRDLHALQVMVENAYRPSHIALLGAENSQFSLAAALATSVPVYRFTRPWSAAAISEGIACLERHWADASNTA